MSVFDKEITESLRSLYDLEVRTDERVKNLTIRSDAADERFSETLTTLKDVEARLRLLESNCEKFEALSIQTIELSNRIKVVEISRSGHDDRWKTIVNFCVQLSLILVAAYLLYKLGLQAPAVP